MANEFVAKNGLISQNNTTVSGSLTVTQTITGSISGSVSGYVPNTATSSFATTGSNTFTETQTITGSGNSLIIRTGAATAITQQTTDFGGGSVGSNIGFGLAAATGNTYGTLAVRNTGGSSSGNLAILSAGGNVAIGKTAFNAVLDVNGNTIVTGSLNVTAGITGSLLGTASTASYITSSNVVGTVTSASYATTASYALNGGGSGVTSIIAGTGISVNQATGDVTITNTGGAGGGISQGQVVAIAIGYSNLF